MMEYKRITQGKITKDNTVLIRNEYGDILITQEAFDMLAKAYNVLADLEDKIEQGTLIEKEVVELFADGEEKFRSKAKFYYERCKSYGIENFYDAELEYEED